MLPEFFLLIVIILARAQRPYHPHALRTLKLREGICFLDIKLLSRNGEGCDTHTNECKFLVQRVVTLKSALSRLGVRCARAPTLPSLPLSCSDFLRFLDRTPNQC